MSFVLRIVGGPNKGAEIALPEGVAVTLGKSDACDVVLADATLPDESLTLAAAPDGVTLDGAALEPFAVVERGATAFAVGPADKAWGELNWPEKEKRAREDAPAPSGGEDRKFTSIFNISVSLDTDIYLHTAKGRKSLSSVIRVLRPYLSGCHQCWASPSSY